MSQCSTSFTKWRHFLEFLVVAITCQSGAVSAQTAQIGDVQVLPVISVSLQVGSTGKETKRTTYSPPPGWYIRSHQVVCIKRYGTSSFAVNTVPAGWVWNSEAQSRELHERLSDVTAKAEDVATQLKLNMKRDDAVYDLLRTSAGNHALILETSATGNGLFRSGSGIELQVVAEMIYIGKDCAPIARPTLGKPVAIEPTLRQVGGSK